MIIGIDTNTFGFHAVSSVPMTLDSSVFHFGATTKSAQDRRMAIFHAATEFFRQPWMDGAHVFIEEPLLLRSNMETTRKLMMVGGMMEAAYWAAMPDAHLYWVDVATWRKMVLGLGSGTKEQLKRLAVTWALMCRPELKPWVEEADDYADAACICQYGKVALEL